VAFLKAFLLFLWLFEILLSFLMRDIKLCFMEMWALISGPVLGTLI